MLKRLSLSPRRSKSRTANAEASANEILTPNTNETPTPNTNEKNAATKLQAGWRGRMAWPTGCITCAAASWRSFSITRAALSP